MPVTHAPELPGQLNLCDYFLDRNLAEGRANKRALIVGEESRTFAQAAEGARRVAAALRGAGVRPEERVLLILPDGFEFAEAWFGVLRAGAVFAMVNPLLKQSELAYYLEYSKARVVISHSDALEELLPAFRDARHCEQLWCVGGASDEPRIRDWSDVLASVDPNGDAAALEPTGRDDLAGWLFTSGSTGKPKACVHTHGDFAYSTETYALQVAGYREDDICLAVPKLFFGYATGTNLMFPFRVGASVCLFSGRSTADELFDQIESHRPTFLTSVPTLINNMLRSPRIESADLSSLRVCLSAGEALPEELYRRWMERTGVEILDGIGSAEMFHIYISNYPGKVRGGSLGQIVPGYEAQIVDPEGNAVADGEPGRLRIRGGSTALCYWADKAKSHETYQADWCTTADIFRREPDGYYFYEGRADDLLKVSGIWVSPLEIENTLLEHDAVGEVCVLGRKDGDGLVKPHAVCALVEGQTGSDELAAELKAFLKDRLAPYKYPRWFEWRASLPKNDRGKVSRKDLKQDLVAREQGEIA